MISDVNNQNNKNEDSTVTGIDSNVQNTNGNNFHSTSSGDRYEQTNLQLEQIAADIRQIQPLASELKPIYDLKDQYCDSSTSKSANNFVKGIEYLSTKYESIRTIRGDGNCYYRAFLYSLCEKLLHIVLDGKKQTSSLAVTKTLITTKIRDYVENSTEMVINNGGYDETAIEIFHETVVDLLNSIVNNQQPGTNSNGVGDDVIQTMDDLHQQLTEENSISDYCTWYLRVLTATYIKMDPERFYPYILAEVAEYDGDYAYTMSSDAISCVSAFCSKQVEPMGKECTMVQVLALVEAFQGLLSIKIEYLDGRDPLPNHQGLVQHNFSGKQTKKENSNSNNGNSTTVAENTKGDHEEGKICLTLLYRPGHYDILYPK